MTTNLHSQQAASTPLYDVFLTGQLDSQMSMAAVQANLAALFKMPDAKVAQLLVKGGTALKKGLELAAAQRYKSAIEKAGALVDIRLSISEITTAPPSSEQPAVVTSAEFSLNPLGDLLRPEEKIQHLSRLGEFKDFTLRPAVGYLLDERERVQAEQRPINPSGLTLSEIGTEVLIPSERATIPQASVTAGDWSLAPAGERLADPVNTQEKAPNTEHLSLAPSPR